MPELPEVETVMRGMEPVLKGQVIKHCKTYCPKLRFDFSENFEQSLSGVRVIDMRRRGKFMVLILSNDLALIWHLGMSGRVKIEEPRRFGFMVLVGAQDWQQAPFFAKMGQEPLGNHFDGGVLKAALVNKTCDIKAALLDQRVVAGIGNIYACEALYQAGISPRKKAGALSGPQCGRLAEAIRDVLNRALAAGGSSLRDYRKADGSLGDFQHSFNVYDREGHPCPDPDCACRDIGGIKRITQARRSTFYCPVKQK